MTTDPFAPIVADRAPLNAVKWAARDYASIFDGLLRRLKTAYAAAYNDYATTTQGIMLLELMAFAIGELQWYLDRIASDCFLETARTSDAAGRIVRQLGYKMGPAAAASTTETVTFSKGTTQGFIMPARWRFRGPGGMIFESYADYAEPVAVAEGHVAYIPIRQGETRILTFTADGAANQTYRLSGIPAGKYVADLSVEVWVDGEEWEERDFLTYAADNQFQVEYESDPPVVRFGDGVAGTMPTRGSEVKVRFVVIDGVLGNTPKADSITTSVDTLVVGGETVTMTVTNAAAPTGGADPETVDHARLLAPLSFAARGAAITAADYDVISNSYVDALYGAVAMAYAFNPRGTYADLAFNTLVEAVEVALAAYVAAVETWQADVENAEVTLTTYTAALEVAASTLENLRVSMDGNVIAAKTAVAGARAQCTTAETAITTVNTAASEQNATLSTLYAYADAHTTGSVRTQLLAYIAAVQANNATISAQGLSAKTAVQAAGSALDGAIANQINPTLDALENAAPTAPSSSVLAVEAAMTSATASISETVVALGADLANIAGTAESLQTTVLAQTESMRARIAVLFSDDCMSNYVQVPILSLNADGDYVAPSVGLIKGLQTYLDGVKEVTQQVEVITGEEALVDAVIVVEMMTADGFVFVEERAKVQSALVGILRGRRFNQPLYLSQLYGTIEAASDGLQYVNVRITGPLAYVDEDGNLVPPANKIIRLASGGITFIDLSV
jgi:hypothetical protein